MITPSSIGLFYGNGDTVSVREVLRKDPLIGDPIDASRASNYDYKGSTPVTTPAYSGPAKTFSFTNDCGATYTYYFAENIGLVKYVAHNVCTDPRSNDSIQLLTYTFP